MSLKLTATTQTLVLDPVTSAVAVTTGGPQGPAGPSGTSTIGAGEVRMWAGVNIPSTWLECDGAAYLRSAYPALFSEIGTTYGAGDGSTTFNVPDFRGRAPIGVGTGSGLTVRARGDKVGVESVTLTALESGVQTHNHGLASHTHTMGSHTHAGTSSGPSTNTSDAGGVDHTHGTSAGGGSFITNGPGGIIYSFAAGSTSTFSSATATTGASAFSHTHTLGNHTHTLTTGGPSTNTTGGPSATNTSDATASAATNAHQNMQPSLGIRFIIKI